MADTSNQAHSPPSPRSLRHAAQIMTDPHELSPQRKAATKVPNKHATQVLPDILTHAKEELSPHDSPVNVERNFVNFEKHLLANHIGSLGDTMIYNKETHHRHRHPVVADEEQDASNSQTTPQTGPRAKLGKETMKDASGSFDMAECFYSDH